MNKPTVEVLEPSYLSSSNSRLQSISSSSSLSSLDNEGDMISLESSFRSNNSDDEDSLESLTSSPLSSSLSITEQQTSESLVCTQHNQRQLEFLCLECSQLICSKCIITTHRSHQIEDIETISQSIINYYNLNSSKINISIETDHQQVQKEEVKSENIIFNRMQYIMDKLNVYNKKMVSYQEEEEKISLYYRELHDYLMIEEYKLKKPLVVEIDQLRDQIFQISSELHELSVILKDIIVNNRNNNNKYSESNSGDDQDLNSNCTNSNNNSMEINFNHNICNFNNIFQYLNNLIINNNNSSKYITDHQQHQQLLSLYKIQFYLSKWNEINNNKQDLIKSIKIYVEDINFVKQTLSSIYQVEINSEKSIESDLVNRGFILASPTSVIENKKPNLYSAGVGGIYTFDIDTNKWNKVTNNNQSNCCTTINRSVQVGDEIYSFKGTTKQLEFTRFNLTTHQWSPMEQISTSTGYGNSIGSGALGASITYDGSRYIYIIGGLLETRNYSNRINRIDLSNSGSSIKNNITTKKIQTFGLNPNPTFSSFSFFYRGVLYLFGGLNVDHKENSSLVSIDVNTCILKVLVDDIGYNQSIVAQIFDQETEQLYILDRHLCFFSLSPITLKKKYLQPLSLQTKNKKENSDIIQQQFLEYNYSMVKIRNDIYLLGGINIGNYKYSIKLNRWIYIDNDNDKVEREGCSSFIYFK